VSASLLVPSVIASFNSHVSCLKEIDEMLEARKGEQ
jgi:hypothetical protein